VAGNLETTRDLHPGARDSDPFDALLRRAAHLTIPEGRLPATLASGFELCAGRYRVLRELGRGGMGIVYEALDRYRGGPVALKTLRRMEPRDIYRLKSEFRALADVAHPNLVRLHHLFEDDGRFCFSMELIDGTSFDHWIRPDGTLALPRLRRALSQIARGVAAIHAAGKLHCDLKPSNMRVTREGRLVILDFGLAAAAEAGGVGQTVLDGFAAGTPAYMSPEQASGAHVTVASDWYAVGVILYEALSGRFPHDGTVEQILTAKKMRDVTPCDELFACDRELAELSLHLLARDCQQRADARAIERALGKAPFAAIEAIAEKPAPEFRFHGRSEELLQLERAFQASEAGRTVVVRVHGEAGIGKSALVEAMLRPLRQEGRAVVLSGRCFERESLPYNAVDRIVDELSRHLRALPPVEAAALMPRDIFATARLFPVLSRLQCVRAVPERPVDGDQALRAMAFDALAELLARLRDRGPLVVHVDDLHWADRDSTRLLAGLLRARSAPALLMVLSHRDTQSAHNQALDELLESLRTAPALRFCDCALGALSDADVIAMARDALEAAARPDFDREALVREAAGNPTFVEDLLRHLRASDNDPAPAVLRLEDSIERRARHLGNPAREVLRVLAVAAHPLPFEALAAVVGGGPELSALIDALHDAQLLAFDSKHQLYCYHDRIGALIAEGVAPEQRAELHEQLAKSLGALGTIDHELLLQHYQAAGCEPEAGHHALQAAAEAKHGLAFDRAAALYRKALQLLDETSLQALELDERLAEMLSLAGRWSEAGEAFDVASLHARTPARRGQLEHQATTHLLASGHGEQGLPKLRALLVRAGLHWPRSPLGAALRSLGRALWIRLRSPAAMERTPPATPSDRDAPDAHLQLTRRALDSHASRQGELELVAAGLLPAYDLSRGMYFLTGFTLRGMRSDDRGVFSLALAMAANAVMTLPGGRALALRLEARAAELARGQMLPATAAAALGFAGFAALRDGRLEQARALGAEGSARLEGVRRAHVYESWVARNVECFALTLLGRVAEAARLFTTNEEEARELGDRLALLGGSNVIGYLVRDDVRGARRLLARKEDLLRTIGDGGGVRLMVELERVIVALYEGRGADFIDRVPSAPVSGLTPFHPVAIEASCALQAIAGGDDAPRLRREVTRAQRVLRRLRTPLGDAMVQHLQAVLCALNGQPSHAIEAFESAQRKYRSAEMELHALLMTWQAERLRCSAAPLTSGAALERAQRGLEAAEASLRALGVENLEGWVRLMAPGLSLGLEEKN